MRASRAGAPPPNERGRAGVGSRTAAKATQTCRKPTTNRGLPACGCPGSPSRCSGGYRALREANEAFLAALRAGGGVAR